MCSGCTACASLCPVQCITMQKDKMGFAYPRIDTSRCVDCGACERACPGLKKTSAENNPMLKTYAAQASSDDVRRDSSSGGLFTLIARYILSQNGVVYGAAFDGTYHSVKHVAVEDEKELYKLQGSKYLQSDLQEAFAAVKQYLEQERTVLFSGTPCQIAGLRSFLTKEYDHLYLLDIVCHGAPAPAVWDEYLTFLEKTYNGKANKVSFRDKRRGWHDYVLSIAFEGGKEYVKDRTEDLYVRGFLHDYYLRPSCYDCNYKGENRPSDITLGDLWGASSICPELDDNKGTSLVMVSSEKGGRLFESLASDIQYQSIDLRQCVIHNPAIVSSCDHNPKSAAFERLFQTKPINRLLNRFCSNTLWRKVMRKVKRILYR